MINWIRLQISKIRDYLVARELMKIERMKQRDLLDEAKTNLLLQKYSLQRSIIRTQTEILEIKNGG